MTLRHLLFYFFTFTLFLSCSKDDNNNSQSPGDSDVIDGGAIALNEEVTISGKTRSITSNDIEVFKHALLAEYKLSLETNTNITSISDGMTSSFTCDYGEDDGYKISGLHFLIQKGEEVVFTSDEVLLPELAADRNSMNLTLEGGDYLVTAAFYSTHNCEEVTDTFTINGKEVSSGDAEKDPESAYFIKELMGFWTYEIEMTNPLSIIFWQFSDNGKVSLQNVSGSDVEFRYESTIKPHPTDPENRFILVVENVIDNTDEPGAIVKGDEMNCAYALNDENKTAKIECSKDSEAIISEETLTYKYSKVEPSAVSQPEEKVVIEKPLQGSWHIDELELASKYRYNLEFQKTGTIIEQEYDKFDLTKHIVYEYVASDISTQFIRKIKAIEVGGAGLKVGDVQFCTYLPINEGDTQLIIKCNGVNNSKFPKDFQDAQVLKLGALLPLKLFERVNSQLSKSIPTNYSAVVHEIPIEIKGMVYRVNITVGIAHNDTNDLEIALVTSNGTRIILQDREDTVDGNYLRTFTSRANFDSNSTKSVPSLEAMTELDENGVWKLEVRSVNDGNISPDSGTLESVGVEIAYFSEN